MVIYRKSNYVCQRLVGGQMWIILITPTLLVKYEAKSDGKGGVGGSSRKKSTLNGCLIQ